MWIVTDPPWHKDYVRGDHIIRAGYAADSIT